MIEQGIVCSLQNQTEFRTPAREKRFQDDVRQLRITQGLWLKNSGRQGRKLVRNKEAAVGWHALGDRYFDTDASGTGDALSCA